jgi:hypothetical protein
MLVSCNAQRCYVSAKNLKHFLIVYTVSEIVYRLGQMSTFYMKAETESSL